MNCELAEEYISALCDGQRIPQLAAEHIGICQWCQTELNEYAAFGAELRRLASLDHPPAIDFAHMEGAKTIKTTWFKKGRATMKIPRFAFALMLVAIVMLSGSLVFVRARGVSANDRFLELKYKYGPRNESSICIMRANGNQKDNNCNFVDHRREGMLLMNTRIIAEDTGRARLGIKAKYVPGDGDAQVNYNEALFKDVPENVLSIESGEKQEIQVAGFGVMEVEAEYLDHIPPLAYRPQETLDPSPKEFRVVAPVLVRDNQLIVHMDGSSIDSGDADATLMLYIPGEGRYLMSVVPFEGAAPAKVHLGEISFAMEGHDYLLLTSMPITVVEQVWVKHEPDFKPSERMARESDAHDDRPGFLVRSLRVLEQRQIPH